MSDHEERSEHAAGPAVSRRDSVRIAAALTLGAGLGVPRELLGMPASAVRLQLKFYKAAGDGGTLVGTAEITDAVTTFIGSAAGTRAQIKWYDWSAREIGTMGIPSMIQDKLQTALRALPPGE